MFCLSYILQNITVKKQSAKEESSTISTSWKQLRAGSKDSSAACFSVLVSATWILSALQRASTSGVNIAQQTLKPYYLTCVKGRSAGILEFFTNSPQYKITYVANSVLAVLILWIILVSKAADFIFPGGDNSNHGFRVRPKGDHQKDSSLQGVREARAWGREPFAKQRKRSILTILTCWWVASDQGFSADFMSQPKTVAPNNQYGGHSINQNNDRFTTFSCLYQEIYNLC